MTRIGIVSEGSHDFLILREFIRTLFEPESVVIDAIQPQVDETLRQVGAGGCDQVKAWCMRNSGKALYQNFGAGLFRGSVTYDHIVVHLDGDVVDKKPEWFSIVSRAIAQSDVMERVRVIDDLIASTLSFSGGDEICSAIPVLSTDAWVFATLRPNRNFETAEVKARLHRYFRKFFGPSNADALGQILPHCVTNLREASQTNRSLRRFIDELPN